MFVDTYLFIFVTLLSFINVHSSLLSKLVHTWKIQNELNIHARDFQILSWISRTSHAERDLLRKRRELKSEQALVNMVDHFAKYSKIQRKINAIDGDLLKIKNLKPSSSLTIRALLQQGVKVALCLILLCISLIFAYKPVIVFDAHLDLYPLSSVISYPTEEVNAISVHVWALACSAAARSMNFWFFCTVFL